MKNVNVVAAIIYDGHKILITQRGYGDFKGMWEFPGGKIEKSETPEAALIREIKEELNVKINVGESVGIVEYDYPSFHLSMNTFLCTIEEGKIELIEHEAAYWVTCDELDSVDWLPADKKLLVDIDSRLKQKLK